MGVSPCYIFDIFISWCIPCDIALIQQVLACANRQTHANTLFTLSAHLIIQMFLNHDGIGQVAEPAS